jgi:trehalose synthase-fused probable maltokinase
MGDALIDDSSLGPFLEGRRWFGAHSRELTGVAVRDTAVVQEAPDLLAVLLADAHFDNGERTLYQLLVGLPDAGTGAGAGSPTGDRSGGSLRSTRGTMVHDVEHAPGLAVALARAAIAGEVAPAASGAVDFRLIAPLAVDTATVARLLGAEQSNTSVILDHVLLKIYRHIEAGLNPELELLLFLTEHGFEHIPELLGWYGYTGDELSATLGVFQRFLADAVDGWSLALEQLGTQPDDFAEQARAMGEVVGAMHYALASDASEPSFAPEDPGPEYLGLVAASAEEQLDEVFAALPDDAGAELVRGRADEIRDRMRILAQGTSAGRLIRTHGDLHLGQMLLAGGRWHIVDFEGEPARSLVERRRKQIPLRDVAGMLRSFSYASAMLEADGTGLPEGTEAAVREQFLEGYRSTAEAGGILAASGNSQERLLQFFELEKAIYELRYELDHRPGWLHVPAAGIANLLAQDLP